MTMQCSKCGAEVKYVTGGMGNSSPPGWYFRLGMASALVGAGGLLLDWPWIAGYFGFAALAFIGWSFVAQGDGYGNRCTQCDHTNQSYPWSM